jgi:hypothetical protein
VFVIVVVFIGCKSSDNFGLMIFCSPEYEVSDSISPFLQSETIGTIPQRRIKPAVEHKLNYFDFITSTAGRFFVDAIGG